MNTRKFLLSAASAALMSFGVISTSVFAQGAPQGSSQEQIEAAKRDAEALGREMQYSPTLNTDGSVSVNDDGTMQRSPLDSRSMENNAALMYELTGVSGYEAISSSAGNKQGYAGAAATLTGHVDINCQVRPGTHYEAAAHSFKFRGCTVSGGRVTHVALQICSEMMRSELCDPEDYGDSQSFPVDAYTTVGAAEVGVGCNEKKVCRVTVSARAQIAGTQDTLVQQAQARQPASELRNAITTNSSSAAAQEGRQLSGEFADCYTSNQDSFESTGKVKTCDHQQEVVLGGGGGNASCEPTRVCVQSSEPRTTMVTTSCTRTWDVAYKRCEATIPTKTCVRTDYHWDREDKISCTPEELQGAQLVKEDAPKCVLKFMGNCLLSDITQYYVFPEQLTNVGTCSVSAPLQQPEVCGSAPISTECGIDGDFYGYCVKPIQEFSCLAATQMVSGMENSDCGAMQRAGKLNNCTLTSYQQHTSGVDGIPVMREERYQCSKTVPGECTEWQVTNSCTNIDGTYGVDEMPIRQHQDPSSQGEVLTSLAVVEEIAKEQSGASGCENASNKEACAKDPKKPRIFPGKLMTCQRPTGFIGDAIKNDCCKLGLSETGGDRPSNACSSDEVKLAASRRDKLTTYEGEDCAQKIDLGFTKKCIKKRQYYCVYTGVLPRIVQEQGRAQLAAIERSSPIAQHGELNFPFYAGTGGWTSPVTLGGQQIVAFQQPTYCRNPADAARVATQQPNAVDCLPLLEQYFAVCPKSGTCGALPAHPQDATDWQVKSVDPLFNGASSLSRLITAQGACDTRAEQCAYHITARPLGVGGRALESKNLSISLMDSTPSHTLTFDAVTVQVAPFARGIVLGTLPPTVPARFTHNPTSGPWTNFDLPTQISSPYSIQGTGISVTGGCQKASAHCEFQFTAAVAIDEVSADEKCPGFTLDEFAALDISKMDLTEWTSTINKEENLPDSTAVVDRAKQQGSTGQLSAPQKLVDIRVDPESSYGPFLVKVAVGPNSETGPRPRGITVDWGDCSPTQSQGTAKGVGFEASHTFAKPYWVAGSPAPTICDSAGKITVPGTGRTMNHQVKITVHFDGSSTTEVVNVRNILN